MGQKHSSFEKTESGEVVTKKSRHELTNLWMNSFILLATVVGIVSMIIIVSSNWSVMDEIYDDVKYITDYVDVVDPIMKKLECVEDFNAGKKVGELCPEYMIDCQKRIEDCECEPGQYVCPVSDKEQGSRTQCQCVESLMQARKLGCSRCVSTS